MNTDEPRFEIKHAVLLVIVMVFSVSTNAFIVYDLGTIGRSSENAFIDVADGFNWGAGIDEAVISDKYLAKVFQDEENYHTLEPIYRARFLDRLGFTEQDSVFIYHVEEDTIYRYAINSLSIAAHLTPYEPIEPLEETEFYIGFELNSRQFDIDGIPNFYTNSFLAMVSKTNPFQTGKLQPIIWRLTSNLNFPRTEKEAYDPDLEILETYYFKTENYKFYIQQKLRVYAAISGLQLCVTSNKTNAVILKRYYEESDVGELKLMSILRNEKGKPKETISKPCQWTGALFKGYPPVIFSFVESYFDCENIDFLDSNRPPLRISCDNRH